MKIGWSPILPHQIYKKIIAEWSSLVAREAHNLKVVGSNPASATNTHNHRLIPVIVSGVTSR
jgi:hypothetical protein